MMWEKFMCGENKVYMYIPQDQEFINWISFRKLVIKTKKNQKTFAEYSK
uniref:Uncharacterized protein n=1 Tax=Anguilla anguilla TaxID=7936 RepID=A0A0E9XDX3_ANGAN